MGALPCTRRPSPSTIRPWDVIGLRTSAPPTRGPTCTTCRSASYEGDLNYSFYQCLERLGKHEEAAEVLARLKQVEADPARIADLSRAIAQRPPDPALRCEAGVILLRGGLQSEGLRWLESALAVDPRHGPTHQALADYYEQAGDLDRAARHRPLGLGSPSPLTGAGHPGNPQPCRMRFVKPFSGRFRGRSLRWIMPAAVFSRPLSGRSFRLVSSGPSR